jgi:hypothetical protein
MPIMELRLMAQSDDFKLVKQIVAADGHKHVVGGVDRDKYQRLVELGWLDSFPTNIESYRARESSRLTLLKAESEICKTTV